MRMLLGVSSPTMLDSFVRWRRLSYNWAGHGGGKVDAKAVARLDRAVAGSGPRLRIDRDGSARPELLARSFEEALGSLIGLVFASQLEGTWPRFKLCGLDARQK